MSASRVSSVDALRGFDMFWIIGGDFLIRYLYDWTGNPVLGVASRQLTHADWAGVHAYDLIFPLFIFLSGVSLGLSSARDGAVLSKGAVIRRAARRAGVLAALGVVYNWGWNIDVQSTRFASVLGLIGGAYFISVLVMVLSDKAYVRLGVAAVVLALVTSLQLFVPAPGFGAGVLTPEGSINSWIDQQFLPGRLHGGVYDPEGLLGVLSASSIAICGLVTGAFMAAHDHARTMRIVQLAMIGIGLIIIGSALSPVYPPIKKIWTATFNLIAIGWCLVGMAGFIVLFDRVKAPKTGLFFIVIGANSILIYMAARFLVYPVFKIANAEGWPAGVAAGVAVLLIACEWAALLILYRRRLFLRV